MIESAAEFLRLRASSDNRVRRRTVKEAAPLEVWEEILREHPDLAVAVAQNTQLPEEIIRRLYAEFAQTHEVLALRGTTPPDLLLDLCQHPSEPMRVRVAANGRTPLEGLERLAEDAADRVRDVARGRLKALEPRDRRDLESKDGSFRVTIEDHGEHHMSCYTLVFRPSRPIAGISRFQTTNGEAFFTPDGGALVLHDAVVIVYYDLRSDAVFHRRAPPGSYFRSVRVEADELVSEYRDEDSGGRAAPSRIPLAAVAAELSPGLGPIEDGRFPSAYP